MGVDLADSRRERSLEMRDQDDPPMRERWGGGYEDMEENVSDELKESGKYRSKDKGKSSGQKEDKELRSRDREKPKSQILKETEKEVKDLEKERVSSRDRRKEDRDERGKDKTRDKVREKDADHDKNRGKERDKDRKDRGKEKEKERDKVLEKDGERGRDKEGVKDKSREKAKDRERTKERGREKEREKHKDRERERDRENDRDIGKEAVEREKGKERTREKEKLADQDKERARDRDRDRSSRKHKDESRDRNKDLEKDDNSRLETNYSHDKHITQEGMDYFDEDNSKVLKTKQSVEAEGARSLQPASDLEDRILKIREERLKKKSEGGSEVLAWVDKSRKLEEKRNAEKEKALQLSKIFEEQDNINGESDDEAAPQHYTENLSGVKILHGLDKVLEGGAVVLTLKDQSILADGDVNQEIDMLENVEMGEQKRRNEAYKAAKKKTGIYDDKFNDEPGAEKKILPQYDDPVADEGITLDASGHFTGEAEKKLDELRKRLQGVSASNHVEDLNSTGKISTDYYTQEEMLKFKKPKKKKSLRKKEKMDLDALEAEAISAGLGAEDLGSRNDGRRRNLREEQEKSEAEMRSNAYQSAYSRADEASKALRQGQTHTMKPEEDDAPVFDDDDDELRKSLERARKLALKKQDERVKFGPLVMAQISTSSANDSTADNQTSGSGEPQENKVVFTEMEEFVWGLQLDEEAQKPESEDVFMDEDVAPSTSDQEEKDEGGWTEVEETMKDKTPAAEEEEVVPDETIHESAVGKGLAGALKLLKDRGTLKETVEWGGRNMDKKKSKLVGIYDDDKAKEIRIERTDEYGRILTPKEAFRLLSHKFHGKGPGKMKQEKRIRQYQEELKIKQMKNADTPSLSVERMREAQTQLRTPYLVLSGNVKPGQTSDPRSGFATVEKDFTGGLTPMLGDKKVEHFLNMKRKSEPEDSVSHKKPKT